MWIFLHWMIVIAYVLAPLAVIALSIIHSTRAKRRWPLRRFAFACAGGLLISFCVNTIYATAMEGRMLPSQVLLTAYLASGMLILLHGLERGLQKFAWWLFRVRQPVGKATLGLILRGTAALVLRAALLMIIGLPYVLATAMTFRPRVALRSDPQTIMQWPYESVSFKASDGTRLAGWWIPADWDENGPASSARTIILCPGMAQTKASVLKITRKLKPAGYNVLAFDFRAHGESGGQMLTFGDLERRDVLAAVHWLRHEHPQACGKVCGIGISTGGAALIAAAVDPGEDGQTIDAVAVIGTYDRLGTLAQSLSKEFASRPLAWMLMHTLLPIASAQTGTNLSAFSPVDQVRLLWPRPVLVIHGLGDPIVPFTSGQELYDAAMQPKFNQWIEHGGHDDVIDSDATASLLRWYFNSAQRWL